LAEPARRANHAEVCREQGGFELEDAAVRASCRLERARALQELSGVQEHYRLSFGFRPASRCGDQGVCGAQRVASGQSRRRHQNPRDEVVILELSRVCGGLFRRGGVVKL
jgi:hypothetical protein